MYTAISNFYEKKGAITITPTHRIRLYIRNTANEGKVSPKLDNERVDFLYNMAVDFLNTLEAQNMVKSKEYLSDMIIGQVTNEQLKSLIENINFNRKTEVFQSGIRLGIDGSVFIMLQLNYSDDSAMPPKEIIKFVFDEKDKIVGVQPIRLQENRSE